MSRQAVSHEGEGKGRRWVFPAVAAGIAAFWLVMSLPRVENTQNEFLPYTTKRAGWPDHFARWSVTKDTGETIYSSFSTGALLGNLVVMAAPIVVAWVIIRHFTRQSDKARIRSRSDIGGDGGTPPSDGIGPGDGVDAGRRGACW